MNMQTEEKTRPTIFDRIIAAIGWLRIAASPSLMGIGIAGGLYAVFPYRFTAFISIGIVLLGIIIGVVWATKIARKRGTVNFMSRASSSEIFGSADKK